MPVLPIADEHGNLKPNAGLIVIAHAIYPSDDTKRIRWYASAVVKILGSTLERVESDSDGFMALRTWLPPLLLGAGDLFAANQPLRAIFETGQRRRVGGLAAARLLLNRLSCKVHHPELAHLYQHVARLSETLPEGQHARSENTLNHDWAEFQSVAHIYMLEITLVHTIVSRDKSYVSDHEYLGQALMYISSYCEELASGRKDDEIELVKSLTFAEACRRKAEEFGILKPERTWRCPEQLQLRDVDMQVPPLNEGALEYLRAGLPLE